MHLLMLIILIFMTFDPATKGHRSLSIFDDGGGVPDSPIRDIVMLCWLQGFLGV